MWAKPAGSLREEYMTTIMPAVSVILKVPQVAILPSAIITNVRVSSSFPSRGSTFPRGGGGGLGHTILRTEAKWIFRLRPHVAPGLIESLYYKSYLQNSFLVRTLSISFVQSLLLVFIPSLPFWSPTQVRPAFFPTSASPHFDHRYSSVLMFGFPLSLHLFFSLDLSGTTLQIFCLQPQSNHICLLFHSLRVRRTTLGRFLLSPSGSYWQVPYYPSTLHLNFT